MRQMLLERPTLFGRGLVPALLLCLLMGITPGDRAHAQILINEAQSANASTLQDEDGDFEDWIEIHNAGGVMQDLDGYALSDDPLQPYKWTFPQTLLAPGKFLVVFASGKNRSSPYVDHWETVIDW